MQVQGKEAWCPRRDEAYLGVLVDDLITRGVSEPYRMFTSRAEYRLSLREDNADLRLTEIGLRLGVVDPQRYAAFAANASMIERERERLRNDLGRTQRADASKPSASVFGQLLEREYTLEELLRRPGVSYRSLALPGAGPLDIADSSVADQVEIQIKYHGYIERQRTEVERQRAHEDTRLPADLDYRTVRGLSIEVQQKLNLHRPETLGQAARISGITPAAMSLLAGASEARRRRFREPVGGEAAA